MSHLCTQLLLTVGRPNIEIMSRKTGRLIGSFGKEQNLVILKVTPHIEFHRLKRSFQPV